MYFIALVLRPISVRLANSRRARGNSLNDGGGGSERSSIVVTGSEKKGRREIALCLVVDVTSILTDTYSIIGAQRPINFLCTVIYSRHE